MSRADVIETGEWRCRRCRGTGREPVSSCCGAEIIVVGARQICCACGSNRPKRNCQICGGSGRRPKTAGK